MKLKHKVCDEIRDIMYNRDHQIRTFDHRRKTQTFTSLSKKTSGLLQSLRVY